MDIRADAGMMPGRKLKLALCATTMAFIAVHAVAQEQFAPEQIKLGARIYAQNCSPCHGPQMADPQGAFDLRTFPPDQKSRFLTSVTKGKNQMPPWGDLFKADEIEALWAYAMAGEKK
jgi:mono/diheme cytochrome c family protein